MGGTRARTGWTIAALALAAPRAGAQGQEIPPPALALVAGAFQYDLSGTGTEPFVALRLDLPMSEHVIAEPNLGYVSYTTQGGDPIRHLTAEVQLQGSWPIGRWRPYLGAGAGGFLDLRKQRDGGEFARATVSAAAGMRVDLLAQLGARAELRVRGIGEGFSGSAAEWSAGISRSF